MNIKNLLLALAAIFVLVSCEKEGDNDPITTKNSHRIKQVIYDNEGYYDDSKYVFTYGDEKLTRVIEYSKNSSGTWNEDYQTVITYAGDSAIATIYYREYDGWELDGKFECIIQGGLMKEEFFYDYEDGEWYEDSKWTYQYSGANISAWQSYYLDYDETLKQDGKGEYIYQNGKLSEYKGYDLILDSLRQIVKETFTYTGSNLINCIEYDLDESDNWEYFDKYEYHYSGDKVSQTDYLNWNSDNSQWLTEHSESYTYNGNGYLVEGISDNGENTTYEYEAGHGNAKLFWYYPEDLVYGEPTLRSASTTKSRKYIPYYQRLNSNLPH